LLDGTTSFEKARKEELLEKPKAQADLIHKENWSSTMQTALTIAAMRGLSLIQSRIPLVQSAANKMLRVLVTSI
jgi:hypothetical protein